MFPGSQSARAKLLNTYIEEWNVEMFKSILGVTDDTLVSLYMNVLRDLKAESQTGELDWSVMNTAMTGDIIMRATHTLTHTYKYTHTYNHTQAHTHTYRYTNTHTPSHTHTQKLAKVFYM